MGPMHESQCSIIARKYPQNSKNSYLNLGLKTWGTRPTNYPLQHTKNLGQPNTSNDSKVDVMNEERGGPPQISTKTGVGMHVKDTKLLT